MRPLSLNAKRALNCAKNLKLTWDMVSRNGALRRFERVVNDPLWPTIPDRRVRPYWRDLAGRVPHWLRWRQAAMLQRGRSEAGYLSPFAAL